MRKEGYSYDFIAKQLGISKSALSIWLRDIPFLHNAFTLKSIRIGQLRIIEAKRSDKIISFVKANEFSEQKVKNLSVSDIFMVGLGIYIGEGSKTTNIIRIVNSDPQIIKFMIVWFRKCFNVQKDNFKIRIHLYPDNNKLNTLKFWMKELELQEDNFHPVYVDRRLNKKRKLYKPLPHGTAHLTIVSNGDKKLGVLLHRKILATIDRILSGGISLVAE